VGRCLLDGELAEERLRLALQALVDRNHELLADVIAGDSRVDELQMEIDDRCFTLLALYQPVAIDLRTIVSALKINADWSASEISRSTLATRRNDTSRIRRSSL
jgi:phosphate transport system protein